MKKALFAAAILGVTAFAGAASAAPYRGHDGYNINQRQQEIQFRIEQGARSGALTRQETFQLTREFNQIRALEASYRRNGLNYAERADLDRRLDNLSARLRHELRDRDGRRYSYNDHGWRR